MTFTHYLTLSNREIAWQIDVKTASKAQRWARAQHERLVSEIAEMAEHFPRWILTLAQRTGEQLVACPACREMVVPRDGAWRCVACHQPVALGRGNALAWIGHLPTLWPDHPRLARLGPPPPGHALIAAGGRRYLLAPLAASYPESWPGQVPNIRYDAGLLAFLGLTPTGRIHMYEARRPCIYYPGQWRGVSIRAVLQQRVVNHLASLVKIALGRTPEEAFIGKIHDQPWEGEF